MSTSKSLVITGFIGCKYFGFAQELALKSGATIGQYIVRAYPTRELYHEAREANLKLLGKDVDFHKTSPLVFWADAAETAFKPTEFLGGYSDFEAYVNSLSK